MIRSVCTGTSIKLTLLPSEIPPVDMIDRGRSVVSDEMDEERGRSPFSTTLEAENSSCSANLGDEPGSGESSNAFRARRRWYVNANQASRLRAEMPSITPNAIEAAKRGCEVE